MSTDIALLITALAFLELGWYYSSAILAVILVLYVYFSYRDLLAQREHLITWAHQNVTKTEKDKKERE